MNTPYAHVFSPLRISGATIPNRIVRTAHGTGLQGEDLYAYHEARARGGVGLSILQIAGGHPTSPTPTMPIRSDEMPRIYENLIARTRPHGMRLFQQISHAGSEVPTTPGLRQWSSSEVAGILVGTVPAAMTRTMIDEVTAGFASAARTAKDSGIDGVEIHGGHGYLVHQFLSPALNHRDDEYGGDFENRMRFLVDIIAAVRHEVGRDYPIGVRLGSDDGIPDSISADDTTAMVGALESQIDFLDLSLGSHWHFHKMLTSMESPEGYELPQSEPIARTTTLPTIVTGRIMTLEHAEQILESGGAQMVSMVRATIADPDLVRKGRSGRESEIRPCTGTNQGCIGMFMSAGRIACAVNASAGNEVDFPEPTRRDTGRVVVVGGGIAGMEVARLARLRGFDVDLHERSDRLGGQSEYASGAKNRSDFAGTARWLQSEITRLGVEIHRSSHISVTDEFLRDADHVVIATGSKPDLATGMMLRPGSSVAGAELEHVHSAWDVLERPRRVKLGLQVTIVDDTGSFDALTVALRLLEEHHGVRVVTRFATLGATLPEPRATVMPALELLAEAGVEVVPFYTVDSIGPGRIAFRSVLGGAPAEFDTDSVVLVNYPRPVRELVGALDALGEPFDMVGDVTGTHDLLRTIYDAALLVKGW